MNSQNILDKMGHYLGISVVVLAVGFSVSLSKSESISAGSGDKSINLKRQSKKIKEQIREQREILDESEEELLELDGLKENID